MDNKFPNLTEWTFRLAIGRAYIFRVQVPEAGGTAGASSDDFEKALEEISACAQINPLWENGVQKAMLLVKSDFGDLAANKLLREAKRASEACEMANGVLQMMPEKVTDGVRSFELSILFNAQGLPDVCVVARRTDEGHHSNEILGSRRQLQCRWYLGSGALLEGLFFFFFFIMILL